MVAAPTVVFNLMAYFQWLTSPQIGLFQKYHSPGFCPSKLLLKHSFNFSWGDYKSQEKLKTVLMQKFGGTTTRSIMVFLKFSTCCNWVTLPCCDSMIFLSASTAACIRSRSFCLNSCIISCCFSSSSDLTWATAREMCFSSSLFMSSQNFNTTFWCVSFISAILHTMKGRKLMKFGLLTKLVFHRHKNNQNYWICIVFPA